MRFRYLRDPLFFLCVTLYFVNRWVLKSIFPAGFFHSSFNDLICIPFWVPIMLFGMRQVGLRRDDDPPRSYEILIPLMLWSVLFELYLPTTKMFHNVAFADYEDVLCYATGALVAAVWWGGWYRPRPVAAAPRGRGG